MKFTFIQGPDSKTWATGRYLVQIQHVKPGAASFIVFAAVNDSGDGQTYDTIYPRFETGGKTIEEAAYRAGGIAEALIREMRLMPEDTPLSEIKNLVKAVSKLLTKAYGIDNNENRTHPQILLPGNNGGPS